MTDQPYGFMRPHSKGPSAAPNLTNVKNENNTSCRRWNKNIYLLYSYNDCKNDDSNNVWYINRNDKSIN